MIEGPPPTVDAPVRGSSRGRFTLRLGLAIITVAALAFGLIASTPTANRANESLAMLPTTSDNWAGYVWSSGGHLSAASASWSVPTLTCGERRATDFVWVGVDGAANTAGTGRVFQAGSSSICTAFGQVNELWWENWPVNQRQFVAYVFGGDAVSARVFRTGNDRWSWMLRDATTGRTYRARRPIDYPGPGATAEWIVEDPSMAHCGRGRCLLPFARFTAVRFSALSTSPAPVALGASRPVEIVQHGRLLALPARTGNHTITVRPADAPAPP